jgi:Spy/CpxP family protein refolding chaperone
MSCACLSAFAAMPAPKGAPDGSKMIEKRLDHMQKTLNLTADQRSQLQTIFQNDWQQQMALRKDTRSKVDAVLTKEQQATLKKEWEERRQQMRQHREDQHPDDAPDNSAN